MEVVIMEEATIFVETGSDNFLNSVIMEIGQDALDVYKDFIILVKRTAITFQCVPKGLCVEME